MEVWHGYLRQLGWVCIQAQPFYALVCSVSLDHDIVIDRRSLKAHERMFARPFCQGLLAPRIPSSSHYVFRGLGCYSSVGEISDASSLRDGKKYASQVPSSSSTSHPIPRRSTKTSCHTPKCDVTSTRLVRRLRGHHLCALPPLVELRDVVLHPTSSLSLTSSWPHSTSTQSAYPREAGCPKRKVLAPTLFCLPLRTSSVSSDS